ncbi:hypothetical protein DV736_g4383, partial [Chaetothyriales sp. CBS 134916]
MCDDYLSIVNPERKLLPGPQLLHELVSVDAEDKVAIDFLHLDGARTEISYGAFHQLSHCLARQIRTSLPQQSNARHIIPVVVPQCPELYIAWRAVLIAGAAFCPVSPDTPLERLRFILSDVSANLVLCLVESIPRISAANSGLPCVPVSLNALRHEILSAPSHTEPSALIHPQDPAYVQYTSGSSGLPKGVIVSHFSVTQSLLAHHEHVPTFKRFLQFASPTFDVSIFEIFFPFFRASTLVGCPRDRMLADLPGAIISLRADAAELTPTVAGTLLRSRAAAPCLKTLLTIGEMLTSPVVTEFGGSTDRDSMLYAMYGPTEAAIHCTVAPKLAADATVRSIGFPLSTVTAFVLMENTSSPNFSIAPRGESGELAVAGQLADGYLNRPDKNADAFIELPGFGQVYRTGDRAICRPDGRLEILGRISEGQVKLRGQRIELGEIEEVASKTPGCSLAIASVIDDSLVLFCVTDPDLSSNRILDTCKAWLPTYMRPAHIIMLPDDVPRLPSGKIDRRQLKALYQERRIRKSSQPEFNNETEQLIADAFQAVLHTNIHSTTSLWSAGLDSLRAIKISANLREKFPHCTLTMLLEAETIVDISNALDQAGDLATPSSPVSENVGDIEKWRDIESGVQKSLETMRIPIPTKIVPCSSMQVAMLTETASISHLNFNTIKVKRGPGVSHSRLWHAVRLLAKSNEILRSGFYYAADHHVPFVQLVWENLEISNLSLLHPLQIEIDVDDPSASIIRIHHAIYDGWSWELILDDLNTILEGGEPPLRPSFLDFVKYQTRRQRARLRDEDADYWSHLRLDSGSLSIPSLAASSSDSERVQLVHNLDVSYASLSKLAEHVRVSRQAILQSCWARLLATYTDATEVIFGDVVSGRHVPLANVDQIIGPCLSAQPIRVGLESHKTFRDLVVSTQRQYLERLRHTETPLHDILSRVTQLKDQRIFDSLFIWQQGEVRPPHMRKYLSTLCSSDALNYTAVIEVEPLENIVQARLTVDSSHIPPSHAELLLAHFNHLHSFMTSHLDNILQDRTLWQGLNVKALSVSNVQYKIFDHHFDLCTTIETLAKSDPQRPAIRFVKDFDPASGYIETETVTYGHLHQRAAAFASRLVQKWNAKADDLICIISHKSINLYIVILAVVMTGAGYMCIDPATPGGRIKQILEQARCAVIITDDSIEIDIESSTVLPRESIESTSDGEDFHRRTSTGNELAYCVWTSGTTGKPKGVLITRQNLLSNLDFLSSVYPCEPQKDALLQSCSPAFDVSVFEIFWTWHMGMELCAAPNDVLFRDVEELINALNITFLSMTPSVAALVNPEKTPKVKTLVTAGEPMNSRVFERWAGRGLFQGYGPSETTNICNVRPWVQPGDAFNNVGPVFCNTSLFVCQRAQRVHKSPLLLQDFHILPKGAVGEIWIGGDQVARGYVDHELTIHSFLDHPQFGRLYRSGDMGRLLADGSLVILGRDDDQAKIRGQRIELGEINQTLIRSSYVQDATSFVHRANGRDQLLTFCTLKAADLNLKVAVSELLHTLENTLPTYMVPDFIIPVQSILLTRQGKVDKASLLQRYKALETENLQVFSRQHRTTLDEEYDTNDSIELAIAEALGAILGVSQHQIKQGTSFYALGLDSINCIRLSQYLTRDFGRVDVSTIMKHPSIKLLKPLLLARTDSQQKGHRSRPSDQYFDQDSQKRIRTELLSLNVKIESILPCTDLQLSMLSAANDSSGGEYHNTLCFSIHGDAARLRTAWEFAQSRHGLLRTVFVKIQSSQMPYAQVVLTEVQLPWHSFEESGQRGILPYSLREAQHTESSIQLKLEIHHALYDAEAISLLLDEVQAIYHAQDLGPPASFKSYLDYMINIDEQATYETWSTILRGSEPCRLADALPQPLSGVRPGAAAHRSSRCSLESLEVAGRKQCVTTLAILEAALTRLLMAYLNTNDVCFGNVFSGRNLPVDGIAHIVGPCFNTLPLRAKCKLSNSNSDLVQQLQRLNTEVVSLQPSSPRRIQRLNTSDGGRLFDVLLLLQQDQPTLDRTIWELIADSGNMSFPFILEILPSKTSQNVQLTLHSDVAGKEVLEQFLDHFDELLHDTINYASSIACEFSSMSEGIRSLNLQANKSTTKRRTKRPLRSPDISHTLSNLENQIKGILLQFSNISIDITNETTIFELGLDSINAVQIAAKLRELGYQISSSAILEAPTLAEIAESCTSSTTSGIKEHQFDIKEFDRVQQPILCDRLGLSSNDVELVRPCTPTQCGILSEYLKSHGSMYYNTIHLQLVADVDKDNMIRAWQAVTSRHDMLRTGFAGTDSSKYPFVMITYKPGVFTLPTSQHKPSTGDVDELLEPPWHLSFAVADSAPILRVSMLHALYDAQSLDIFLADVSSVYNGRQLPLPVSISPVVSSILARGQSHEGKEFWQEDRNLIQPTKFPDLNINNEKHRTLSVSSRVSTHLLSHIKERCATLGCSLQAVFQYVWTRILAAYTSQDRVTFGLTLSGRDFGDERDDAAFPCINTLPVTVEIGNDRIAMLSQISKLNAGLSKSQHIPLTSIRRWQGIEGDTFDSLLVFQKFKPRQSEEVPWRPIEDEASAEYAVSLEVLPDEEMDLIKWQITYSEQILPAKGAQILVEQLDFVLGEAVAETNSAADPTSVNLSILPAKEPLIPTDIRFLHDFVERSALFQADAPALEFVTSITDGEVQKSTWRYSELEHQGNRVANLLATHDVNPGDLVAICFDKCSEASFAILGVLKAGAAYVAIDPGAPVDRKVFIVKDAGCKIVLTSTDKTSVFHSIGGIHVILLDDELLLKRQSSSAPRLTRPLSPEDTCYCLYTSGSTGTPKGCLISHQSAVQAMMFFQRVFGGHWTASSRWLQFASFHFDVSVLEQYFSWSVGICVTSGPRDLLLEDLPSFIRATGITHLDLTPTLARLMVPEEVPSISNGVFIVGGEQVTQDIIDTWGDAGCLYNFYGPSEVTIGCTVHPRVRKGVRSTNIGQQWDNVGSFVLDPGSQQPVLRGAVGELCLSGVLVGKGYLNRSDLTKEKFVTLENYGTKVYRTGDLVRLLNDDSFDFVGRIDDQVKLRGQRLEIGEINQTICEGSTEVKAVATLAVKHHSHGREQLVAFISTNSPRRKIGKPALVFNDQTTSLTTQLRDLCAQKLPSYMIPTSFVIVSDMPLSANNKIDNKVLRAFYESSMQNSSNGVATKDEILSEHTQIFERLCQTLETFLCLPNGTVKPSSRLFELGIDSVSAIGFARKLKMAGFGHVGVPTVLRNSTASQLFLALNSHDNASDTLNQDIERAKTRIREFATKHQAHVKGAMHLQHDQIESIAPCTPLQEGMISAVTGKDGGEQAYFLQLHLELRAGVDLNRLRKAWREVQSACSILRTFFVSTPDGFAQVVSKDADACLPFDETESRWRKDSFGKWIQHVISFGPALPWRVNFSINFGGTYMTLFIFHGLYDGISLPMLLDKVAASYNGEIVQRSIFYDVLSSGPLLERSDAKPFWKEKFKSALSLGKACRTSVQNEIHPSPLVATQSLTLSNVKKFCTHAGVTEPAVFHTAWLLALHEVYGINATLGIVLSGRSIASEGAELVIGPMLNTVPCGIGGLRPAARFLDLAKACHKFVIDVLPYQHTALRDIAKWTGHDLRTGMFDCLFVFQKQNKYRFEQNIWREGPAYSTPDYPLNLEVEQKLDGAFILTIATRQEYMNYSELEVLLGKLENILKRFDNEDTILLPEAFQQNTHLNSESVKTIRDTVDRTAPPENIEWTATTEVVREVVAELADTHVNAISLNAPTIFELGLDSIDVMKLATRLRARNLKIPISEIMRAGTVARIAAVISQTTEPARRDAPNGHTEDGNCNFAKDQGIHEEHAKHILPVTSMQEGLLLDFQKYYNVFVFELRPDTDVQRMKAAWSQLTRIWPILRVKFEVVEHCDGSFRYVQVISGSDDGIEVEEVSLSLNTLDAFVHKMKEQPDELEEMLALRVVFVETREKRYMLTAMSHASYDAWSLQLLHQELGNLYRNPTNDTSASAGRVLLCQHHLDAIAEQARSVDAEHFWEKSLVNLKPTIFHDPSHDENNREPQVLQRRSTTPLSEVQGFCKTQGITIQSLGLACWSLLLAHYTQAFTVCFGLILSGRTTEGSDELVLPTFNAVIFHSDIQGSESRAAFVKRTHHSAMDVSEFQHFPLRKALKMVKSADMAPSDLFNTLFTYQKGPDLANDAEDLYHEVDLEGHTPDAPYAVNVEMENKCKGIKWTVATQLGIASRQSAELLLESLDDVLEALVHHPKEVILSSAEDGTSICGLPPITLSSSSNNFETTPQQRHMKISSETWTKTEATIRDVLAEVSKVDPQGLSKTAALYELGLDSVSAIKITSLLKKKGIKLPVSKIVQAQTIERMGKVIEGPNQSENHVNSTTSQNSKKRGPDERLQQYASVVSGVDLLAANIEDIEDILPATAGQMYMLETWKKSGNRSFYPTFWFEVNGATESELQESIKKLQSRVAMLRSTFVVSGSRNVLQVVIKASSAGRFSLPWTYTITSKHQKVYLGLKLHHALYDAVSLHIMVAELARLCKANPDTRPLNQDLGSFTEATIALDGTAKASQRSFWTSYLGTSYDLRYQLPRGSFSAPRVEKYVPSTMSTTSIGKHARQEGVTIQSLFFAACGRAYSDLVLGPDSPKAVLLGLYLANRSTNIPDLPSLVSPTFNIVPLKINVSKSLVETARDVQRDIALISKAEQCGISLREVYEWTGLTVDCVEGKTETERVDVRPVDDSQIVRDLLAGGGQLDKASSPFSALSDRLGKEQDMEWVLPSVDIEAKVEDGALGVGVFSPADMLDQSGVEGLMAKLVRLLTESMH